MKVKDILIIALVFIAVGLILSVAVSKEKAAGEPAVKYFLARSNNWREVEIISIPQDRSVFLADADFEYLSANLCDAILFPLEDQGLKRDAPELLLIIYTDDYVQEYLIYADSVLEDAENGVRFEFKRSELANLQNIFDN